MSEEIIETASGLGYVDLVEGTGATPKAGESVTVHYTGWLKSGQKFDSSVDRGQPFVSTIGRSQVIKLRAGTKAWPPCAWAASGSSSFPLTSATAIAGPAA